MVLCCFNAGNMKVCFTYVENIRVYHILIVYQFKIDRRVRVIVYNSRTKQWVKWSDLPPLTNIWNSTPMATNGQIFILSSAHVDDQDKQYEDIIKFDISKSKFYRIKLPWIIQIMNCFLMVYNGQIGIITQYRLALGIRSYTVRMLEVDGDGRMTITSPLYNRRFFNRHEFIGCLDKKLILDTTLDEYYYQVDPSNNTRILFWKPESKHVMKIIENPPFT